ncbi:MAG TPA: two-component regulator propeller domain-containing protein [Chitinophagaceae bacterium]|nr:two-component regulator propeller domain-containing protein [Chitinophagaceae bacterium]
MKRFVALMILMFLAVIASAQLLPSHRYTSKEGLVADRITAMSQDENGVLWIGSYFGLCSYNGISFQKVDLPFEQQNKFVTSILPLHKRVYAGLIFGGGLVEYSNGSVKSYVLDRKGDNSVMALGYDTDTSILVANSSGTIFRFSNGKFTPLLELPDKFSSVTIHSLLKDIRGNIWIATERGLLRNTSILFENYDVFALHFNSDKNIWVAMTNGHDGFAALLNGSDYHDIPAIDLKKTLPGLRSVNFHSNGQQDFWGVQSGKGVVNIKPSGEINYFPTGLNEESDLRLLFVDRERNLWAANDPGLVKISNFSSVSYLFDEPAAAGGFVLKDEEGTTWATNSKFLYRVSENVISKTKDFRKAPHGYLGGMLFDENKNLWIVRWDAGIWKTQWSKNNPVSGKLFMEANNKFLNATSIAQDHAGNIWLGGQTGILRISNGKMQETYTPEGGDVFITTLCVDTVNHAIWIGTNSQGVKKISYTKTPTGFQYSTKANISVAEGLKDPYVRSILVDARQNIWVGTRAGGIYNVQEKDGNIIVKNVQPRAGISCSRITAIAEEGKNAIWFASCEGIYRFVHDSKQWQHFTVSDGLLSAEVFHIAVDNIKKEVWALTESGITKISYDNSVQNNVPPLVNLTSVNVLGKPDTNALMSSGISKYSYGSNSIGFSFAAATYLNEKKVQYKYMLEGYDHQWSEPVTVNAVNYASLKPGKYSFKVMAANAKGIWSAHPASFDFEIIMPIYLRTWFIVTCLSIALFILYIVRIDRLKQKYKVEKLRLRIARDLHDDIGSALGSINLLSETANRRLARVDTQQEAAATFGKIGSFAQTTLESMDDIIWSINPDKDKVEDLLVRMREFAIPLLEAKGIAFDFQLRAADYKKLSMNLRKNVFLIFKEALFNVVKHSESTKVHIATEIRGHQFYLLVRDNGKGFDPDVPTERNGLKNLNKRTELLDGKLVIATSQGNGTTVELVCPIR